MQTIDFTDDSDAFKKAVYSLEGYDVDITTEANGIQPGMISHLDVLDGKLGIRFVLESDNKVKPDPLFIVLADIVKVEVY